MNSNSFSRPDSVLGTFKTSIHVRNLYFSKFVPWIRRSNLREESPDWPHKSFRIPCNEPLDKRYKEQSERKRAKLAKIQVELIF